MKVFMKSDVWKELEQKGLIKEGFRKRLDDLVIKEKIDPGELVNYCSCNKEEIYVILNGKSFPSFGLIMEIATAFEVSVDYLLGREDSRKNLSIGDPKVLSLRSVVRKLTILRDVLSSSELDEAIYGSKTYSKTVRRNNKHREIAEIISKLLMEENPNKE